MRGDQYYEAMFSHSNVGITTTDPAGNLLHWNEAFRKMLGYSNDELRHLASLEFTHPSEIEQVTVQYKKLVAGTLDHYQCQRRYLRKDGSDLWGNVSVTAIRDEHGMLTEVMGVIADITDQLRDQPAVQERAAIIDQISESVISADLEGRITSWNRAAQTLFGYSPEEALGQPYSLLYPEEALAKVSEIVTGALEKQGSLAFETRLKKKTGECFEGEVRLTIAKDQDGAAVSIVGSSVNISDRKRASEKLQKSEARLAEAQRIGHLGNWDYDATRDVLWWSDETCRIMGITPEGFVPDISTLHDRVHPDDIKYLEGITGKNIRPGSSLSYEFRIVRPDGTLRTLHTDRELVFDNNDKLLSASGTVLDITEREKIEADLRKSQFLLSEAERIAHLGTWDYDVVNDELWWSDETFRILGHPNSVRDRRPALHVAELRNGGRRGHYRAWPRRLSGLCHRGWLI